jgi:hypothetical protein
LDALDEGREFTGIGSEAIGQSNRGIIAVPDWRKKWQTSHHSPLQIRKPLQLLSLRLGKYLFQQFPSG